MSEFSIPGGSEPPSTPSDLTMNRGPAVVILSASTWALGCVVIVLRFLSRRISRAPLLLDDWLVLASQVLALGGVLLTILATAHGFGQHAQIAGKDAELYTWRCVFATNIIYTVAIFVVKMSILAFYWRLFKLTFLRWPIILVQGINVAWAVSSIFLRIFQCSPIQKTWIVTIPGECFNPEKLWLGSSVTNIVTDFVMLIMPLPCIWSMNITRTQRILSSGIFLLGGCVSVVSIIRFLSIYYLVDDDITWNFVPVATWTTTEMNLAIVSACLPCLRPIVNLVCKGRSLSAPSDPRRIDPTRNTWHRLRTDAMSDERHGFVKLDDGESTMKDFESGRNWRPSIFEMKALSSTKKTGERASATTVPVDHMGWD